MVERKVSIGLAGLGTVGMGVYENLQKNADLIAARSGIRISISHIVVRDPSKPRPDEIKPLLGLDWQELVKSPDVDVVVELIGGTTQAYELVKAALHAGKPVVTGNKALLAEHGGELFALSAEKKAPLHFEAAVAGGIPIIRAIQESFVANNVEMISGIINGTSNYILERMASAGLTYPQALDEARKLGYAEADPTLDVNGWDAAHKALLLCLMAYGFVVDPQKIHVSGIENVRPVDLEFAQKLGYCVKLLAVIRKHAQSQNSDSIELRVQPSFIAKSHLLSSVNGVFNAIALRGDVLGESLFYGRGAGKEPTASSVLADIVEAARAIAFPLGAVRGFLPYCQNGNILPIEETTTSYYVRFDVVDRPGVIAEIARVLADHCVGISGTSSPVNPEHPDAAFVDMVFLLHPCPYGRLMEALKEVELLNCVNSSPVVFRIENLIEK